MEPKYPDVTVRLSGENGNAFKFVKEAMTGDYDAVLQTAMKWVRVE
jgi:hypothetical protein